LELREDLLTLASREPNPTLDSLTPYLLLEPAEEKGVSPDFLTEMEARIDEDESIKPMLRKAVIGLSQQLSTLTMNNNYKPYIHVSGVISKICSILS
jgi:ubiquitin conjugation factor E4 B